MKKKKGRKFWLIILIAIACVVGYFLYGDEPEESPDTHESIHVDVYPGQKQ